MCFSLATEEGAASFFRPLQQKVYAQPIIAFTKLTMSIEDFINNYVTERSLLQSSLPPNVGLMTVSSRGSACRERNRARARARVCVCVCAVLTWTPRFAPSSPLLSGVRSVKQTTKSCCALLTCMV